MPEHEQCREADPLRLAFIGMLLTLQFGPGPAPARRPDAEPEPVPAAA
jgi:hypothetical protein